MTTLHYALKRKGPKRLKIIWDIPNLLIMLDDIKIAHVSGTIDALKNGHKFTLPDSSALNIQLFNGFPPQLRITRNDFPVPGSPSDPYPKINAACGAAFLLGGIYAVVGSLLFYRYPALLGPVILGYPALLGTVIAGLIMIVLAFIALQRKSFWALLSAILIHVFFITLPNLLAIKQTMTGGFLPMFDLFFRLWLVFSMIGGLQPLWFLKTYKRKHTTPKRL